MSLQRGLLPIRVTVFHKLCKELLRDGMELNQVVKASSFIS